MPVIVDKFASSYGWTKDYILKKVYPDEAVEFINAMNKREAGEALLQLAIVHNPHSKKPQNLVKQLERKTKRKEKLTDEKMDKQGLERLKKTLSHKGKKIKVK